MAKDENEKMKAEQELEKAQEKLQNQGQIRTAVDDGLALSKSSYTTDD
jgi:hypothetical protein